MPTSYDPANINDFRVKYRVNLRWDGIGDALTVLLPCPFCAEPAFVETKITSVSSALREETTCEYCDRKGSMQQIADHKFGWVLWEGEDPPEYFELENGYLDDQRS